MSEQVNSSRAVKVARWVLITAITVVATLIVMAPKDEVLRLPTGLRSAAADGGVCTAPGYLMLTMNVGASEKLYITDTAKQVICVYSVNGDALRLVSARKFDFDSDIADASQPINGKPIEGGNGISRKEAEEVSKQIKAWLEGGGSKKKGN